MKLYHVTVHIYEAAAEYSYPVVTHIFMGKTRDEAWGYHAAHRRTDSFLKTCEDRGVFGQEVRCRAIVSEGWV